MSRSEVLALLRQDEYISGEEISRQLGVSRAAVWKAVRALRAEGCRIDSVPNRGYCLRPAGRLNAALLQAAPWSVVVPEEVDSTNNVAKQLGAQGAPHGTVVANARPAAAAVWAAALSRRRAACICPSCCGRSFRLSV